MSCVVNPYRFGASGSPAAPGAPYARPSYNSATGGNVSSLDVAYPTLAANDIALLHVAVQQTLSETISTPSGWTAIYTNIGMGTDNVWRHSLLWKRLAGTESGNQTVSFSGSLGTSGRVYAAMSIWRGCITSGTPYELSSNARNTNAVPGMLTATTTSPDRTFVNCYANDGSGSVTKAPGTGFTELYDLQHPSGGASLALNYFATTVPQSVGEIASMSSSNRWSGISIALIPQTTVSSSTPASTDPFFSSVKLLCGFESSIADESSTARTLTAVGNAARTTSQAKMGSASCTFDGSGDYITAPDSADWLLDGPFTVELFVRMLTKANNHAFLGQWDNTGSGTNSSWFFWYTSGGNLLLRYNSGGANKDVSSAWTPTLGTWYHVVGERDISGTTRLYIDGAMVASGTNQNATPVNSPNVFTIGRIGSSGTSFSASDLNGQVDEVRITKIARYNNDSGFTVPTAAFPRS